MKTQEARDLGKRIAAHVHAGHFDEAHALLTPVLASRTQFRLLALIGEPVGAGPLPVVNDFLEQIAAGETMGGWVVIASALDQQMDRDRVGALARCRHFVIVADVWYAIDTFGERTSGPALVADFEPVLNLLAPWREDDNRWVRRIVGVTVHFWAKRARGVPEQADRARTLLTFLEPMFGEWEIDAVKGVGWGLKTMGRYFPDPLADWLAEQVVHRQRRYRALMLRKALTYLSDEQRARATGGSA